MTALGKAHILTVYINLRNRGYALENQICIKAAVGQLKAAFVNAHRINIRHIWRIAGKRIIYIGIIRPFIALCLPAGRNLYGLPFLDISGFIAVFKKSKAPLAVQRRKTPSPSGIYQLRASSLFSLVFCGFS